MIPTVNVTTTIRDHAGNPVAGAIVKAKLSDVDLYQHEYVYPVEQSYVADVNGLVTMSLFPNAIGEKNTVYTIKATDAPATTPTSTRPPWSRTWRRRSMPSRARAR
jgi:hypothetical protein